MFVGQVSLAGGAWAGDVKVRDVKELYKTFIDEELARWVGGRGRGGVRACCIFCVSRFSDVGSRKAFRGGLPTLIMRFSVW